jgi:hypothetical protein
MGETGAGEPVNCHCWLVPVRGGRAPALIDPRVLFPLPLGTI